MPKKLEWRCIRELDDGCNGYATYLCEIGIYRATSVLGEYEINHWGDGEYYAIAQLCENGRFMTLDQAKDYCERHWRQSCEI